MPFSLFSQNRSAVKCRPVFVSGAWGKGAFYPCLPKECVHKISPREVSLLRSKKSFLRVVDSTQKTDILFLVETESHTLVSCLR